VGRSDNPFCRTSPPGYIGWWNWFLVSCNVYKLGLCSRTIAALAGRTKPLCCRYYSTLQQTIPSPFSYKFDQRKPIGRGLQRDVVYLSDNSALLYGPKCGGVARLRGLSQWVQLYTRAKLNFRDLTPNLTYCPLGLTSSFMEAKMKKCHVFKRLMLSIEGWEDISLASESFMQAQKKNTV
jgi:hypothetical protein